MILAIDSSGEELLVVIADTQGDLDAPAVWAWSETGEKHQESLFAALAELGSAGGPATLGEIHAIAVVHGPGSYTGVRVGLAAAAGIAYARRLPMRVISSLGVAALRALVPGGTEVLAVVAAGRGRVHVQPWQVAVSGAESTGADRLLSVADVAEVAGARAVSAAPGLLTALVGSGSQPPGKVRNGVDALAMASRQALGRGEPVGYDGLTAVYGE